MENDYRNSPEIYVGDFSSRAFRMLVVFANSENFVVSSILVPRLLEQIRILVPLNYHLKII